MKRPLLLPLVALVLAGCEKPTEPEKAAVSHLENLKNMLVNIMQVFHYPL